MSGASTLPSTQLPSTLTYEQCIEIIKHKNFYRKTTVINGFTVTMFNYMIAREDSFFFPEFNALEMRGLTFVHDDSGPEVVYHSKRMLHKFFTLGQTKSTMPENLTDPITHVSDKYDGSMIRFIELPDGSIVAKTKMSFESEQAIAATEMLRTNQGLATIVTHSLANGIVLIFEFTAKSNQIVLIYDEPRLTILQARRESTGEYLPIDQWEDYPFRATPYSVIPTLQELIERAKTETHIEGWIVRLGEKFVKVKTQWYLEAHRITTGKQPHNIAALVIDSKFDDYSQTITPEHPMYETGQEINTKLTQYIITQFAEAVEIASGVTKATCKEFARANNKHPMFSIIMIIVNKGDIEYARKVYLNRLSRKICGKTAWETFASKHF